MEDALAPLRGTSQEVRCDEVLILVVMEDALAQLEIHLLNADHTYCLNPCCNGRCTRT